VRKLGRLREGGGPAGRRVAVLCFDYGPAGTMTYTSNAQRADMVKALRECATRLSAGWISRPSPSRN
jgi:hypothetical protein